MVAIVVSSWSDKHLGLNIATIATIASTYMLYGLYTVYKCRTNGHFVLLLFTAAAADIVCGWFDENVLDVNMMSFFIILCASCTVMMAVLIISRSTGMRLAAIGCAHIVISFLLSDFQAAEYIDLQYIGVGTDYGNNNGSIFNLYFRVVLTIFFGSLIYSMSKLMCRTTQVVTFSSYFLVSASIIFGAIGHGTLHKYYAVITDVVHMDVDLMRKLEERYFLALLSGWLLVVLLVFWRMFHKLARKRKEFYDILLKEHRKEGNKLQKKIKTWKKEIAAMAVEHLPTGLQDTLTKKEPKFSEELFTSLDKKGMKQADFAKQKNEIFARTQQYITGLVEGNTPQSTTNVSPVASPRLLQDTMSRPTPVDFPTIVPSEDDKTRTSNGAKAEPSKQVTPDRATGSNPGILVRAASSVKDVHSSFAKRSLSKLGILGGSPTTKETPIDIHIDPEKINKHLAKLAALEQKGAAPNDQSWLDNIDVPEQDETPGSTVKTEIDGAGLGWLGEDGLQRVTLAKFDADKPEEEDFAKVEIEVLEGKAPAAAKDPKTYASSASSRFKSPVKSSQSIHIISPSSSPPCPSSASDSEPDDASVPKTSKDEPLTSGTAGPPDSAVS
eukprot:GEMP01017827.1.p1 GENE.GEMP01017827.1~~GEMP01017827.1.p1  ORF type:complete len:611 (+),score=102.51 GEMP01017827.1:323-2155(+)